jgi:hypothetical protein
MYPIIVTVAVELSALFFLTQSLTQNLYISLFMMTQSRPFAISLLSIIFFPGTVVHELAHLFTAEILGVRTGGLTLVPEGIDQTEVRTGSVSISQTDPFRRALIGLAPVFVGLLSLSIISYYIPTLWQQTVLDAHNSMVFSQYAIYCLLLSIYSLFAISNSMFASREDMEGFPVVAIALVIIIGALYLAGVRIVLPDSWMAAIDLLARSLAVNLGYVLGLNIVLFLLSKSTIALISKITGRRFIRKTT